jgi:hypothetical protein
MAKMRLPVARRRLRIKQRSIGESGFAVKRIAEQDEQGALTGPVVASFDRLVACRDLGVEDVSKLRTKEVEMIWVNRSWHDFILAASMAGTCENPK